MDGSSFPGGADRSRSVFLGSGAVAVMQQRRSSAFRWWLLASSILHGLWLWRVRSDQDSGDLERDLSPIWSGIVWWMAVWCRGWLWRDKAVLRRKNLARRLVAAWQRFGGDRACRQRGWLLAVHGLCEGKWAFGCLFLSGLACYCLGLVVVFVKICPSSFERGFGSFNVESMPLFWYHGCTVAQTLWLGLLAVPAVCRCVDELPSHVVWRFWDTVLERVLRFIFILVTGLYFYTRVWLLPLVARVNGRIWWLVVGLVWLTEVGRFWQVCHYGSRLDGVVWFDSTYRHSL